MRRDSVKRTGDWELSTYGRQSSNADLENTSKRTLVGGSVRGEAGYRVVSGSTGNKHRIVSCTRDGTQG